MAYLTPDEITRYLPTMPRPPKGADLAVPLRSALQKYDMYSAHQIAGRLFPIACVALEITQRCNLDCTLCYLSDLAEAVHDTPLFELKRRIKMIHDHYGDHTNIQITGGDPTLRSLPDLIEIVREIKSFNMRCALFTNGIKASREMLVALSTEGLDDIVFHVDLTQERKGFKSEMELNAVRLEYIERARNLPVRILFNTTIYDDNVREVPQIVKFFMSQSDRISLASFQLQAETGRGVLGERDGDLITQERVKRLIQEGVGIDLGYDFPLIGHPDCNVYTALLTAGDSVTRLYDDGGFFTRLFETLAQRKVAWPSEETFIPEALKCCLKSPALFGLGLQFVLKKLWALRGGLIKGRKPSKISFFIHNFMDAKKLDPSRCEACVFMVATANGPMSMCVHNAKRDEMISQTIQNEATKQYWNPLTGKMEDKIEDVQIDATKLPKKKLKGKLRANA